MVSVSFVWHTEQVLSFDPSSVVVGSLTVTHSPKVCPFAAISCASCTTVPQSTQTTSPVDPFSVQVASFASRTTVVECVHSTASSVTIT